MVLVSNSDLPVYYKEESESARTSRFCLKPVRTLQPRGERKPDAINVQIVRGKTTTFIQLDEEEARKVQQHGDAVVRKLQKIHKSVLWNVYVGRSYADRIQRGKQASDEVNLDHDENSDFDPTNPRTWSEDTVGFVRGLLRAAEFRFDGFVVLFCVEADPNEATVDYDEMAWELEKCLVYHLVASRQQVVMNEEGTMSRRGLDPVSRKTKTPGRKRSGYLVYMAYQLLETVTQDQIVGEAINRCVDLSQKKRQLLASLTETKLLPQLDEKVRKQLKELREFMSRDQLAIVSRLRDIREPDNLEMITQFVSLLRSGGRDRGSAMIPQLLSFLNKGDHDQASSSLPRSGSRLSNVGSPRTNVKNSTSSTLPRPSSAATRPSTAGSRKPSNATYSISSRSSTPDTPRKNSSARHAQRRESSLASIPSDESPTRSSTPDTLRKEDHKASAVARKKPQSAGASRRPETTRRVSSGSRPIPGGGTRGAHAQSRTDSGSRSGTPRAGSARSSVNGDAYSPRLTPTGSPRVGSSVGARRGGRPPPDPDRMITREDLRRMNRSYPSSTPPSSSPRSRPGSSTKKPPSSFSRTSIPMS